MNYQRVKGCYDILPEEEDAWKRSAVWQFIETKIREIARLYGFHEVRTPVFEYTDLFMRSVGESSDIVSKEMYTFEDKGGRSLTLKPEWTASVLRAYLENNLYQKRCQRFYYIGSCYRYDRPQKGRYRQFAQFGVESIGVRDPFVDVETIAMSYELCKQLGINKIKLLLNSIGDQATRDLYATTLKDYLLPHKEILSEDSQRRLLTNPLRILDSKDKKDREILEKAPNIIDSLSEESRAYFDKVCEGLEALSIPYEISSHLVRGLDYYSHTVFEFVMEGDQGAQNTIAGGGRYDGLLKTLGGQDLPGIGFAAGIERIIQAMIAEGVELPAYRGPIFYFLPLSLEAKLIGLKTVEGLRQRGISAELHYKNFHVKKGLQAADLLAARYVVILGDDELAEGCATVKELATREERKVPLDQLVNLLTESAI